MGSCEVAPCFNALGFFAYRTSCRSFMSEAGRPQLNVGARWKCPNPCPKRIVLQPCTYGEYSLLTDQSRRPWRKLICYGGNQFAAESPMAEIPGSRHGRRFLWRLLFFVWR